ncbi:MAG: uncharacterized protein QOJ26_1554, partial [Thermoplasmata archaeon]|nr:uncharacterized protein [Thermoplasmata archaeon]
MAGRRGAGAADSAVRTARWSAWDGSGLEVAKLLVGPSGTQAAGELAAESGERPWAQYAIACDAAWRTLDVRVQLADGRSLVLQSDGAGSWRRDGKPVPELAGAIDVDLSGSPLTNTFPIRRPPWASATGRASRPPTSTCPRLPSSRTCSATPGCPSGATSSSRRPRGSRATSTSTT